MKLKWPTIHLNPPSYRTLRIANYTVAAMAMAMAVIADHRWAAMICAWVAGFNMAAAIACTTQERMKEGFDKMCEAFHAMADANNELIAGRVEFIINGGDPNEPPKRPSVH